MNEQKRCWAEISPANILHNYRALRAAIPEGCRFLGVVKADAYGHGALETAQLLEEAGADYLAVACLDEALELRRGGITMPILILGHTPGEYTKALTEHNITQTVTGITEAEAFSAEALRLGTTLRVHMAVDTGMSRIGFLCTGRDFEQGTAELILMSVVERIVFADNGADGWIGHVCLFLCGRESLPILANLFLFKAAKMRYNLGVG